MHIMSRIHKIIDTVPQKAYTLAGFESGPSVPEADAMFTAPGQEISSFSFL
jgi:hypothetical protein